MFVLIASVVIAASFDAEMSAQERQQTGISKLSAQEKITLQSWIDAHYSPKKNVAQGNSSKKQPLGPSLQENLNNGRFIRLNDGSLWEIRASDTPITQGWITEVEIKIGQTGDATYPYKLTNSLTGSSVYARKAENTPSNSQHK